MKRKWSIIIFCYNEEDAISNVIIESSKFIEKHADPLSSEIILVNDGSTDNTLLRAKELLRSVDQLNIINLPTNQGIGNALNKGYDVASGEYICAIPGDGQFDIEELSLFNEIPEGKFIAYYRSDKKYSLFRSFLTVSNYWFNRFFLNITFKDVNWVKVYTRKQLDLITRTLNSSLVESEIVIKLMKKGYSPIYIHSKYLDRSGGVAKGGGSKTLMQVIFELKKLLKLGRS